MPDGTADVHVSPPPPGVLPEDAPTGAGTADDPFHSINHAIRHVDGGGTVLVHAGVYVEPVDLTDLGGTEDRPIVVRPRGVDRVTIDATVRQFRSANNSDWQRVGTTDEFVSAARFDQTPGHGSTVVSDGAFLRRTDPLTGRPRHTRLVSYHRREDLLSSNQLWPDPVLLGENPDLLGPEVVSHEIVREDGGAFEPPRRRPVVYMGPGLWFDRDTGAEGRRIHIRLAPTTNQISGWPDYTGPDDPRRVALALSTDESHALRMLGCSHLRFEHLTLRFGGSDTIRMRGCAHVVLDHLTVWAGSRALRFESENTRPGELNDDIEVIDCVVDGGLPTWFFRSDRKDEYRFRPAPGAAPVRNRLGAGTGGTLISGEARDRRVRIHHCEIANGHDVQGAFGALMEFHHNWVHNINDDGLIMTGAPGTQQARVYRNVITQTLTGLSFAGGQVDVLHIFRNLFDLRAPTLGNRPTGEPGEHSLRQGTFYKDGDNEGPFDLYANTCIVRDPGGIGADAPRTTAAGFSHYRPLRGAARRRAIDNLFVAVYSQPGRAKPIAFLPPATFRGPTDGNGYHRFGTGDSDRYLLSTTGDAAGDPDEPEDADEGPDFPGFATLALYKNAQTPQEKAGFDADPRFRSFSPTLPPQTSDDFRLRPDSPAHNSTASVPPELHDMDRDDINDPFDILISRDRGCYRNSIDVLEVGVGGRRRFPRNS